MNKLLNTLIILLLSLSTKAGCVNDPSQRPYDKYFLYSGRYLYDSIQKVYYKHPNDTVRADVSFPSAYSGSCYYTMSYFYNDSNYTNNHSIDFYKITKPGKYKCIKELGWYSADVTLVVKDSQFAVTSIEEIDNQDNISTLGNPFSDKITLRCSGNENMSYEYQLLDVNGLTILSGTASPIQDLIILRTENIMPGVYFISLKGRENMTRSKVLKLVKL